MARHGGICIVKTGIISVLFEMAAQQLKMKDANFAAEAKPEQLASQVARRVLRDFSTALASGAEIDWSLYVDTYRRHRFDPEGRTKGLSVHEDGIKAINDIRRLIRSDSASATVEVKQLGGPRFPAVAILIFALKYTADQI